MQVLKYSRGSKRETDEIFYQQKEFGNLVTKLFQKKSV